MWDMNRNFTTANNLYTSIGINIVDNVFMRKNKAKN